MPASSSASSPASPLNWSRKRSDGPLPWGHPDRRLLGPTAAKPSSTKASCRMIRPARPPGWTAMLRAFPPALPPIAELRTPPTGLGIYSSFDLGINIVDTNAVTVAQNSKRIEVHDALTVFLGGSGLGHLSAIPRSRKPPPVPRAPAGVIRYRLAPQRSHVPGISTLECFSQLSCSRLVSCANAGNKRRRRDETRVEAGYYYPTPAKVKSTQAAGLRMAR